MKRLNHQHIGETFADQMLMLLTEVMCCLREPNVIRSSPCYYSACMSCCVSSYGIWVLASSCQSLETTARQLPLSNSILTNSSWLLAALTGGL